MSRKNGISCESDKFPGIGGPPLVLQFIDLSVYRYYAGFLEQPLSCAIFSPRFTEKPTPDKESLNRLYNSAILMPTSLTAQQHNKSYL